MGNFAENLNLGIRVLPRPLLCRGGAGMLRQHLHLRQISHRFTSSFTNPSFQDLNGSHIMY